MPAILSQQLDPIRNTLRDYLKTHPDAPTTLPELDDLLAANKLSIAALRDPWGQPFHLVASPNYTQLYRDFRSAGMPRSSPAKAARCARPRRSPRRF